ncbi:MAG: VWA domain-containing protein [Planctomycetota bacterium]
MSGLSFVAQMPFVHPSMAAAALAVATLPLILHLLYRRRYVRVPWAAMVFLLAASRRSLRRMRLEKWLLLFTRVVLVLAAGLAVARPFVRGSLLAAPSATRTHHVVLIDNSLSMAAKSDRGATRFDEAKSYVERLMGSFPVEDLVSLVPLAAPCTQAVATTSRDRRFAREQLAAIPLTSQKTDFVGAADVAMTLIQSKEVAPGNTVVYLISDLPAELLKSQQLPTPAVLALRRLADALEKSEERLTIIRIGEASNNAAVTGFWPEGSLLAVNTPVSLVAEVANFGSQSLRGASLEFVRAGRTIRREPLPPLDPGRRTNVPVTIEFSTSGTHPLEARLVENSPDALVEDNRRFLSLEVPETIRVLVVDGRPGAGLLTGHAGFVLTALAPSTTQERGSTTSGRAPDNPSGMINPKALGESDFDQEVLGDYAMVVLCNVPRLTAAQWKLLERFVSQGGGLLVFGGDLVSPDNYNRFGFAEGSGVLPGRLSKPTQLGDQPTRSVEEGGVAGGSLRIDAAVHPIVSEFAKVPSSGLFAARVEQFLPIAVDEHRVDVVLRYWNGEPAWVASSFGKGRIVVCTTSANMSWNNLPAKGDFVSLLLNTVAHLVPRPGMHRNVEVGQCVVEPLAPNQSSLIPRLVRSDGAQLEPAIVAIPSGTAVSLGSLQTSGMSTLSIGSETLHVAVNPSTEESFLTPMDEAGLRTAIDRPFRFVVQVDGAAFARTAPRATELAQGLFIAVLVLLLLEAILATAFSPRGVQT